MNTEQQALEIYLIMRKADPKITKAFAAPIIARSLYRSPKTIANYLSKHHDRIRAHERTIKHKRKD